jgi:flagellar basal-body rod protein FlgG
MIAEMHRMDVVANNLANVDKTAFKYETPVFKAYPEMLIRRGNDDGVVHLPIGSYDVMPMVGKMGTGVELNESFIRFKQGALKETHNPFDLALDGEGFLVIETPEGERYTRNGSFLIDNDGFLVTKDGYKVQGEKGAIRLKEHNFVIDQHGRVIVNGDEQDDPDKMVDPNTNEWRRPEVLDRLRVVDFENKRYLEKQGDSFYRESPYSGPATEVENGRPKVVQGFLEASNVNVVSEMVRMIEVQRSYEASQKTIQSADQTLQKLVNEVLRMG